MEKFPTIDESKAWFQTGAVPIPDIVDITVQTALDLDGVLHVKIIQVIKDSDGKLINGKIDHITNAKIGK